jgi:hypothetical protein
MSELRIVVLGTMASAPYAGMAWMHMQFVEGFRRLGHDVYYFETTGLWPYDPTRYSFVDDSEYTVSYLKRVLESFGFCDHWAYRRTYSDKEWLGMSRCHAEEVLATADVVLNISGATPLASEGLRARRIVCIGTDPVTHEIAYLDGQPARIVRMIDEQADIVTYGENIGTDVCPLPPLPRLRGSMRQPILLDLWKAGSPCRPEYTTVCNWKIQNRDIVFRGETYSWSKHLELLKYIDLPKRCGQRFELAIGEVDQEGRAMLESNGWTCIDPLAFTTDPWPYRDYIRASRGEFSVAKDQNVRLRTGWFSERSACYLAAGRPVVTQDTGFGQALPTGEGLFAFQTMGDIQAALEAIESDYGKHSRAARDIAEEYFRAETVLERLLETIGLS